MVKALLPFLETGSIFSREVELAEIKKTYN